MEENKLTLEEAKKEIESFKSIIKFYELKNSIGQLKLQLIDKYLDLNIAKIRIGDKLEKDVLEKMKQLIKEG